MTENSIKEPRETSQVGESEKSPQIETEPSIEQEDIEGQAKELNSFNSGPWSDEEISLLIEALNHFKWTQWEEMRGILKSRSPSQLISKVYHVTDNPPTISEDKSFQLKMDLYEIVKKVQLIKKF